jgi:catechol 2,3-dioxygenase-like lactoylglutathione lyase family enzyme
MIFGLHVLLYSNDAEADRAFFRDVLGFCGIDVGGGWLIFRTLPAELAVHPIERLREPELAVILEC